MIYLQSRVNYRRLTDVGGRRTHDPIPALDPGTGKRGHSDSFELAERRISDSGDCRRRDRATRAIVSVN